MNYPMKYTICGFNQQKLFEYSLDINDAQILRWLIDFAATGKMRKLIENNTVYYLVNYEAIICAFPIMGITSTKAIANRFEKYVKCGLLQKTVRKGGTFSGTATLFAITALVGEMIYEEKSGQNSSKEAENKADSVKSDKNQTSCRKTENAPVSKSDKNQTSYRDKNQTSCRKTENAPVSKSDKNQTSYRDKNQTSCRTGTELPVALKNSSLNSSAINSSSRQPAQQTGISAQTAEEELALKKILNYYVDSHGFSEDFIPHLHKKLTEFEILPESYQEFIDFAYTECNKKVKDKSRLMSYIYNSVCDNYFITQFLQNRRVQENKKIEREKQMIICPVCRKKHHFSETCSCGLKDYKNKLEIEFFKKVYQLPDELKKSLENELDKLSAECGFNFTPENITRMKTQKESIYNKYVKVPHEDYIKIFG